MRTSTKSILTALALVLASAAPVLAERTGSMGEGGGDGTHGVGATGGLGQGGATTTLGRAIAEAKGGDSRKYGGAIGGTDGGIGINGKH